MALQNLVGTGLWLPVMPDGYDRNLFTVADQTLDADEEEVQLIGRVQIDGNAASKTFGTSGSKISWLPGASITFAADSTLRVGVKKAATIDASNGPVARATIGAAAFDVYDDLVGGTDTITSTTWRDDTMSAGTPFTVNNGDLIAICFHLDSTGGTPSVKVRNYLTGLGLTPTITLVTSGPTYTNQAALPNAIITFDDGTLGWITGSVVFAVAGGATSAIGNGNIIGNVFQVPFPCKIDAMYANVHPSTNAADFQLGLYSTPLGTPALVEGVDFDANITAGVGGVRGYFAQFTTPRTLDINTDYLVGIKQTTATTVSGYQYDVNAAAHFKPNGMGAECYAANSTAGATFSAQNSGKRRYHIWVRVSALDDGVGGGGGGVNRALLPSGVSALG